MTATEDLGSWQSGVFLTKMDLSLHSGCIIKIFFYLFCGEGLHFELLEGVASGLVPNLNFKHYLLGKVPG